MECWPRMVDPTDAANKKYQYAGWPKTIEQGDNYGREAAGYLPSLKFKGVVDPVVQVVDEENGEVVYTLRVKGDFFRPKVFKKGSYAIRVGRDKLTKSFKGVKMPGEGESKSINVKLGLLSIF